MTKISKDIWKYLLSHQITITVEYLPGCSNVEADRMSRSVKDSSEWKLNQHIFQNLCRARGTPCTDLFASRLTHQVPLYFSWKIDPYSRGQDAFQARWTHIRGYAFPPFCLIGKVLWKVSSDLATIMIVTPAWQTQSWYPQLLQLSIQNPILVPHRWNLLLNPQGEVHPLIQNQSLQLVAWMISGKESKLREYHRKLQSLSVHREDRVHNLITNRPGASGIAGVVQDKLIPFDVL